MPAHRIDPVIAESPDFRGPVQPPLRAEGETEGGAVALKFPKPQLASVEAYRAAFAREAWVGARVHNPRVGRVIELPPGRQTRRYTVMPL